MIAYRYDSDSKKYTGEDVAYLDPLESIKAGKEIFTLPANCTFEVPPKEKEGYDIVFRDNLWRYEKIIIPEPEPEPELTPEEIKQRRIFELEQYLLSTDWYFIRFSETGKPMPDGMREKRQEARDEISRLRGDTINDQTK